MAGPFLAVVVGFLRLDRYMPPNNKNQREVIKMLAIYKRMQKLAQHHPVLLFIAMTYFWSWSFWIPIHIDNLPPGMPLALTFLGVFGPALAGSTLLRLQNERPILRAAFGKSFFIGATLAAAAILTIQIDLFGVTQLIPKDDHRFPIDSPWYVYSLMALTVFISGLVFSNIQHAAPSIRAAYAGLVPNRKTILLAVPVILFLPALIVCANLISKAVGLPFEPSEFAVQGISVWLPLMVVKLFTVAMLTGGNEEHGWRGVLLPILQQRYSPLVATLIVALAWEPWHLPITLDIMEGNPNLVPILFARLVAILPIAFLMTFLYNASRGSIFLCVLLHACFNTQIKMLAGSGLIALFMLVTVILLILFLKPWRRDRAHTLSAEST